MMDIVEWQLEHLDSRVLARGAFVEPLVDGPHPDLLLQIAGLDDFLPIWGGQSLARAFGCERIGPFEFVGGVNEATLPVSANLTTPSGAVTAVAHLYEDTGHVFIGYNASNIDFMEPIVPPFVPEDPPRVVTNPTTDGHLEIRRFLETRLTTGRASLD
jgi:hypothetical protein